MLKTGEEKLILIIKFYDQKHSSKYAKHDEDREEKVDFNY